MATLIGALLERKGMLITLKACPATVQPQFLFIPRYAHGGGEAVSINAVQFFLYAGGSSEKEEGGAERSDTKNDGCDGGTNFS